jgi:hypothetical protein
MRPLSTRYSPQVLPRSSHFPSIITPVSVPPPEDAARFMGEMRAFRQAWPHWDYAAELVLVAATTGKAADIERAAAQIERALRRDNWL